MKTKLFTLITLLCSLNVINAQVNLHPVIGGSFNTYHDFRNDNENFKGILGYHFGVGADFSLGGDLLSIEPILRFNQRGLGYESTGDLFGGGSNITQSMTIRLNYLELPVMFNFNTEVGDIKLVYSVGPYAAYCVRAHQVSSFSFQGQTQSFDSDDVTNFMDKLVADGFNRLDYGLLAGVRAEINNFTIGLNGGMSAQSLFDSFNSSSERQLNLQLSVGYKIEL